MSVSAWATSNILMLGNSYTSFNQLDSVVAQVFEAGGEAPEVHALTSGGLTLTDHATRAQDKTSPWYEMLVSDNKHREWVILQDQSQIPSFPQHNSDWQASYDGALTLNDIIIDAQANTLFFLTWGRLHGDATNPDTNPDFLTMQENLTDGYFAYQAATSTDTRTTWIAPVGFAFADIYFDGVANKEDPTSPDTLFAQLYNEDGSHPSVYGTYLAATVFYATITGKTPIGLALPKQIEKEIGDRLQVAADAAVFGSTDQISYIWEQTTTTTKPTNDTGTIVDTDTSLPTSETASDTEQPVDSCGCATTRLPTNLLFPLIVLSISTIRRRQTAHALFTRLNLRYRL
jgi:hypothetical protein